MLKNGWEKSRIKHLQSLYDEKRANFSINIVKKPLAKPKMIKEWLLFNLEHGKIIK